MMIRDEQSGDEREIDQIITVAFANHPYSNYSNYSNWSEGRIVKRLRAGNALTLWLIAEETGQVVGRIAFSPVRIGERPMSGTV